MHKMGNVAFSARRKITHSCLTVFVFVFSIPGRIEPVILEDWMKPFKGLLK